jgi:hypothetical protein
MSTTSQLALGRHHLTANRRMIVARSLASAVAGVVPVPMLDDWLSSRVRRGTIRRIAAMRGVDVDDDAVTAIAEGEESAPSWTAITRATLIYKVLSRSWRKVLITYVATNRARHAARAYSVATLFDHYCARLHVGLGLDADSGMAVRRLMDASLDETEGGLGTAIFRRSLVSAAKASVRAPAELINLATGGRFKRLLRGGDEVVAVAEVDSAIERSMEGESGFLARAARAVEAQLSSEGNPYVDQLLTRFEQSWRERSDPGEYQDE